MIPIEAITDDTVRIDQTRRHVEDAPRYDPQLERERYWSDVYAYYGYAPYWGPGYVYPARPYYP
jgi:hypothetical protein